MQIWRYAEQGSIELLWISRDQPGRVAARPGARSAASWRATELFVVVQDLFLTETARARRRRAAGGDLGREDRHVHQRRPHRAPVRAGGRPARRGARRPRHLPRLRAPDGLPRPRRRAADQLARRRGGVRGVEGVLARAGRATTAGLTYERLRDARRHPVAVHRRAPDGTERLYADGASTPTPTTARTYGHDLVTGAAAARPEYRAKEPRRARVPAAPPTTSRRPRRRATTTRCCSPPAAPSTTSTPAPRPAARRSCDAAAPDVWVELSRDDADARSASHEGDRVRVESPRGAIEAPARIGGIRAGRRVRPVPLRLLGPAATGAARAANELTITAWDPSPSSRMFKVGARSRVDGRRWRLMQLAHYLGLLHARRRRPRDARSARSRDGHRDEPDVFHTLPRGSPSSATRTPSALAPFAERYGEDAPDEPDRLHSELFRGPRSGGLGLLRDLHDLYLMAARMRHGLDARRPGRPGRPRQRAARRRRRAARARPRRSSSGCAADEGSGPAGAGGGAMTTRSRAIVLRPIAQPAAARLPRARRRHAAGQRAPARVARAHRRRRTSR